MNSITATCPKCQDTFVFDSVLTGSKSHQQFDISCVPIEDAVSMEGMEVRCKSCGYISVLTPYVKISHVAMFLA